PTAQRAGGKCTPRAVSAGGWKAGQVACPWSGPTSTATTAGAGLFPLNDQLAVWDCHWSERLAKYSVWLSGLRTFDQAAEILGELAQVPISCKTVWRLTQRWGRRAQALEA